MLYVFIGQWFELYITCIMTRSASRNATVMDNFIYTSGGTVDLMGDLNSESMMH